MQNDSNILQLLASRVGSADWDKWQIQRWAFYDYVRIPTASASTLQFFAQPVGGTDPVSGLAKTLEQTNLPKARSFGQVYFIVQQIRCDLRQLVKARQHATAVAYTNFGFRQLAIVNAIRSASFLGVLTITIGQKEYFVVDSPFRRCPPGYGITQVVVPYQLAAGSTGNAHWQVSNAESDIYSLGSPQMIEPEQIIEPVINFPDIAPVFTDLYESGVPPNVEAGVILDGYIARPVQ